MGMKCPHGKDFTKEPCAECGQETMHSASSMMRMDAQHFNRFIETALASYKKAAAEYKIPLVFIEIGEFIISRTAEGKLRINHRGEYLECGPRAELALEIHLSNFWVLNSGKP